MLHRFNLQNSIYMRACERMGIDVAGTLTWQHLDHTPENCSRENLRTMCAPCHLRYDARQHTETRRRHRMEGCGDDTGA